MSDELKNRIETPETDFTVAEIARLTVALEQERVKSQRYRMAAESATNLIYEWDIGSRVEWLGHIDELLGYQPNEIPRTWEAYTNLLHSEDRDRVLEAIQKQLKSEEPYSLECRVQRKDGTYLRWQDHGSVVRDESGKPVKWIGAIMDITERKKAEEALRESEEKYRLLVENAAQAIIIEQDGMLKFVNRLASQISGYSKQELLSMSFIKFIYQDDRAMVGERHRKRLQGDLSVPKYAFRWICKDGSFRWVEVNVVLMTWEGKPATLNFLDDITERKKAEEDLIEAKISLELAIDASKLGVWVLDLIKDTSVRNLRHDQIFGYNEKIAEWGAKTFFEHIITEDRPSVQAAFDEAMKTDRLYFECRILWPDKSVHCITATGKTVKDSAGKPQELIGTVMDITKRKRAEEALVKSENRYRTLFESSHDAIMTLDPPSWKFTSGNLAMVKMFMAKDEAFFLTIYDPWSLSPERQPDGRVSIEKAKEMIEMAVRDGSNVFEWMHKRLNGEEFLATVQLTRIELAEKTILQATVRDITALKKAEEALRSSEEKFRAIFDNANDGILLADIETKQFYSGNTSICQMLGYSLEEIKNLGVTDIHPTEDLPHVIRQFEGQLRKEIAVAKDLPVKRKDGSVFYVDINSSLVTLAGKTYILGLFRDTTERKKKEEENLKHVRELEIFYKASVGREERIIGLKKEIEMLKKELGK
jgi:PAS domain S-box-containing protein